MHRKYHEKSRRSAYPSQVPPSAIHNRGHPALASVSLGHWMVD
jgi:hypothetical protein